VLILVGKYLINYLKMTEIAKNKVNYIESKKRGLAWPVLFLVFIILISAGLFAYDKYLQKQKVDLNVKVEEVKWVIDELKNKPEIQVYSFLENNKGVIDELEKRSKITTYITHLKSLSPEDKYWIKFEWFNILEGKINTTAIIESVNDKTAYEKTRDFIRNYRTDSWALLNLEFVNLIEWSDTIRFDVNFKIK
jgi:hypothetical protein